MKHFRIKKRKSNIKKLFIQNGLRQSLPKPKIPLNMIWKINEPPDLDFLASRSPLLFSNEDD